jgi:hypothetical protein
MPFCPFLTIYYNKIPTPKKWGTEFQCFQSHREKSNLIPKSGNIVNQGPHGIQELTYYDSILLKVEGFILSEVEGHKLPY